MITTRIAPVHKGLSVDTVMQMADRVMDWRRITPDNKTMLDGNCEFDGTVGGIRFRLSRRDLEDAWHSKRYRLTVIDYASTELAVLEDSILGPENSSIHRSLIAKGLLKLFESVRRITSDNAMKPREPQRLLRAP